MTSRAEVCESPPRGQVVQTNRAAVRRVPRPREGAQPPQAVHRVSGGSSMKARIFAAVALAAALAVAASTRQRAYVRCRRSAAASKITVWLQVDAQSGWPDARRRGKRSSSRRKHPGVDRQRAVPDLGRPPEKFDATLAGGNAPDVIEMGNTEMTKYMAAGAFADLTADRRGRSRTRQLAQGPRGVGRRTTASSTASRTTRARASSPTAPTCSRRPRSRCRRRLAQFTATAKQARDEEHRRRASRRSTSPAPTGTSR